MDRKPMTILSVNVGRPREVLSGGRIVRTGVFKNPVAGRVRVNRTNLSGDEQADLSVHGGPHKAVYAYTSENYTFWERELARALPFGQFGENLTVEGMPETRVSIGDVFRMGSAVLQVTQPRAPCFKLGLKMGSPRFLRAFLESGRTGFYLRVLEEGEVGAGDTVEAVSTDPRQVTVLEMTRLLFSPENDLVAMRKALSIPTLSDGLRSSLLGRLSVTEAASTTPARR
jgi:MOSC domain-containing protein YiiM